MSRHRSAYNDEDFEDYEDDYYDDYYEEENQEDSAAQPQAGSGVSIFDIPAEQSSDQGPTVDFIIDSLGGLSMTITREKVEQMYDMYQHDAEKTIEYFSGLADTTDSTSSTSSESATTASAWSKKPVTISSLGSLGSGAKKTVTLGSLGAAKKPVTIASLGRSTAKKPVTLASIGNINKKAPLKKETHSVVESNKEFLSKKDDKLDGPGALDGIQVDKLAIRLEEQKREEAQRVQDLDFMGFGEEASKIDVPVGSKWTLPAGVKRQDSAESNASSLATDNAPLSDDEYDGVENEQGGAVKRTKPVSTCSGARAEGKEEKEGKEREKAHMTMVVAGHVDAGKSTLVGTLLYNLGAVAQRTIHKYKKESADIGKGSFALAWVMDESAAEREHGVTIDIAEKSISTENKAITILDAPGHRDFIPNMISGATFADTALLVVPGSVGEYESSTGKNSQTQEHAVLLKALGVNQVIVVVNKMDMSLPAWDQTRFAQISSDIGSMLSELQFNVEKGVRFIPVAGLSGENVMSVSGENTSLRSWYNGPTLVEAIDSFKDPVRHIYDKPMRAIVSAIVQEKDKSCVIRVSVTQGRLRTGRGVSLTTAAGVGTVKSILTEDGDPMNELHAGQVGTITVFDRSGRSGEEMNLVNGLVLAKGPPLPPILSEFRANVLTMAGIMPPILPGSCFEMYLHGQELLVKIKSIESMVTSSNNSTGGSAGSAVKGIKLKPKCVPGGRSAVVIIEILDGKQACVENFEDCRSLGRFALRATGGTVAVGVVSMEG